MAAFCPDACFADERCYPDELVSLEGSQREIIRGHAPKADRSGFHLGCLVLFGRLSEGERLILKRLESQIPICAGVFLAQRPDLHPSSQDYPLKRPCYLTPSRIKTFNTKAKIPAPNNTVTGNVRTQASSRFRSVSICKPERFAAMVPATPDDKT